MSYDSISNIRYYYYYAYSVYFIFYIYISSMYVYLFSVSITIESVVNVMLKAIAQQTLIQRN